MELEVISLTAAVCAAAYALWRTRKRLAQQKEETALLQAANQQLLGQIEQLTLQIERLQSEHAQEVARLKAAHNDVIADMKAARGVEITEIYRAHALETARLHHAHLEALAKQALAFADAGIRSKPKELRELRAA